MQDSRYNGWAVVYTSLVIVISAIFSSEKKRFKTLSFSLKTTDYTVYNLHTMNIDKEEWHYNDQHE